MAAFGLSLIFNSSKFFIYFFKNETFLLFLIFLAEEFKYFLEYFHLIQSYKNMVDFFPSYGF